MIVKRVVSSGKLIPTGPFLSKIDALNYRDEHLMDVNEQDVEWSTLQLKVPTKDSTDYGN